MSAAAIIVAGGRGRRFGTATPKQFLLLNGRPVFLWSVRAFKRTGAFRQIVLVVPGGRLRGLAPYAARHGFDLVAGGKERFDSVRAGLAKVRPGLAYVAVHDAARPLVSVSLIRRTLAAARAHGAAVAAVPARDTVKLAGNARYVRATVPRNDVWLAQTPQVFRRTLLEDAYAGARAPGVTDDAQAVERRGGKVRIVPGDPGNIKITGRKDLAIARLLLRSHEG